MTKNKLGLPTQYKKHPEYFDAVITIFNAVGHLTKSGFEKAIRNIHRNLNAGGIYVFDILNLEAMTDFKPRLPIQIISAYRIRYKH
jgi:SAM-dependent methyltransferase